jgi:hypothetical protein
MTYNQERHIELLKRSQDFKNQGKSFSVENKDEFFELCQYDVALESHIFWEDQYHVDVSMAVEDFLNRKIDGEELFILVCAFRRALMDAFDKFQLELISGSEKIKDFQPDKRSPERKGVAFLDFVFSNCDYFMDDYENDEFYDSIKNEFLDFQKALNEESDLF